MKLYEILPLFEARAKPELNQQIGAIDQLRKYKNDPNVYITFTTINKVGINPDGLFGGTPVGIYAFPLQKCWELYNVEQKNTLDGFPHRFGERKYIQVIKWNGKGKFVNVTAYTAQDGKRDFNKLKELVPDKLDDIQKFEKNLDEGGDPFRNIYIGLKNIVCGMNGKDYDLRLWNHLFRKLGYAGFNDDKGYAIHSGEEYQAMFFSAEYVQQLETILNVEYTDKPEIADIDPKSLKPYEIIQLVQKYGKRVQKFEPYLIAAGEPHRLLTYMRDARMTGRWPAAEPQIYTDGILAAVYAMDIVKHRIPEAEPVILKSGYATRYKKHFGIKDLE